MTDISYFFWFATINLIWLTIQDYTGKKMIVDDRKNWIMLGIAISLISHLKINIWYYLGLSLFYVLINTVMNKSNAFGEADNNTLSWIMMGLGIINPGILLWFLGIFTLNTIIYIGMQKLLERLNKVKKSKVQFYPVILLSFVLNTLLFRYY